MKSLRPLSEPLLTIILALILFGALTPAFADDASKNAKIEEMMQLTQADHMIQQMLDQMKTMLAAQLAKPDMSAQERAIADELQQKIMALFADRMSWDRVKPKFVKIYADTFTESEIDGILAFYKSSAGRSFLTKMPQLMEQSMAVGKELMGNITPEVQRMVQETLDKHKPN
jgi:hypothetical protein